MDADSIIGNRTVRDIRIELGRCIGKKEKHVPKDKNTAIVVGCPNTAIPAGEGFSQATGIPYQQIIMKKKECGRTFILPNNKQRLEFCNKKIYINKEVVVNKEIFVVDDSIVRGNTCRSIIQKLKDAGASKVHFRIISPPVRNPCHYGIDFPTHEELIGHNKTEKEIGKSIGADSIVYCSLEDMKYIMDGGTNKICTSCFDGIYNKKIMDW